jgi:DNA invertase Pin-like site-specific DNA recombinase
MRVLGYARVSSVEQVHGTSLQDQQDAIKAYAASRGLKVHRFYVEAESGIHERIEMRAQIQLLLKEARKGDHVGRSRTRREGRAQAH